MAIAAVSIFALSFLPEPLLSQQSSRGKETRVRISWGGGVAQTWQGTATVKQGELFELVPLSLAEDGSTSVLRNETGLEIRHNAPSNFGGADVTIIGDQARLELVLTSLENPDIRLETAYVLNEISTSDSVAKLDDKGNRVSISRLAFDAIQFEFDRDHVVFRPREVFKFNVGANHSSFTTGKARLGWTVKPAGSNARSGRLLSKTETIQLDESGSSELKQFEFEVPTKEGVYNLDFEMEPVWYQSSFNVNKQVVRRSVQIVVIDPAARQRDGQQWHEIAVVDSAKQVDRTSGWAQFSRFTGQAERESIGNEARQLIDHDGRSMMQLLPGGWQAIPITVGEVGKPHVVELEYLSELEVAFGLSLLDSDPNDQVSSFGFDSGAFKPANLVHDDSPNQIKKHQFTVWPKSKQPYLLVANRHAKSRLTIGRVFVSAGPERLPSANAISSPTVDAIGKPSMRKRMAFIESPMFAKQFGLNETIDPVTGQTLDDWQMFYEGADRLIQYLKANSYRGAFITVAADGGAIYPSELLNPTPKYDTGVFFSNGRDPVRKDVLEMLFRMFEKEHLVLVPAMAFSEPLPEIEGMHADGRNSNNQASSAYLVGLNGQRPAAGSESKLPIYNPLSRNVQRAVTRVVEEVATRYRNHKSFEGISIICRPDTYTMLPGRNWGYDATTMRLFAQSQADFPIEAGGTNSASKLQQSLVTTHRQQWIDWRSVQMSRWYEDTAATLKRILPSGKLYLASVDIFNNEEMASAMTPSLHGSPDVEQEMLHMGFRRQLIEGKKTNGAPSGIVFLNSHRFAPDQGLSAQRVDIDASNSKQAKSLFAQTSFAGDLFMHRMSWAHFQQLQTTSPFDSQRAPLTRLQQMLPAGQFNRARFARAIKDRDSRMLIDGGWALPIGQETELEDFMAVFSHLPDAKFSDAATQRFQNKESIPIAVREYSCSNESFLYVVNGSPWPIATTLWVNVGNSKANIVSLSSARFEVKPSVTPVSSGAASLVRLQVTVEPFGMVGAKTDNPMARVEEFDFEFPNGVADRLRKQVYRLQSKLADASSQAPMGVIENPDFEMNGQPLLIAWDTGKQATEKVQLDMTTGAPGENGETGLASVVMKNDGPSPVWIRSNVFDAPVTGRLSISVWLKTDNATKQPPLRLSVEGQTNGGSYYRFGSVGGLSPDATNNQLEESWKRFAVHFDDIPVDLTNVRIGFDLMGEGQVHVDRVRVFDRWFDENDAAAITQTLASASPLLTRKESYERCRQILTGYWMQFLDTYVISEDEKLEPSANVVPQNSESNEVPVIESEESKKIPMFRRWRKPQRKK